MAQPTAEYNRARREQLKASGACGRCLKRPRTAGYASCEVCRERQAVKRAASRPPRPPRDDRQKRRQEGRCTWCGADAGGYSMCLAHRQARAAHTAGRRQRLAAEGICEVCLVRPARRGRVTCQECAAKQAARRRGG